MGTAYTTNDQFTGSSNSIAYEYISRLVAGFTSGEALYNTKKASWTWDRGYWRNWVVFNVYGDPSLKLISPIKRAIYVDVDADGHGNGSSWDKAYRHIQNALATARLGDEIRVAKGTYTPDLGRKTGIAPGDRTAAFRLANGVTLRGGYAGLSEADSDTRDIDLYETILSGDLAGDDAPDFSNIGDNSYNVVTLGRGVCEASVLDGFTIAGGSADANYPDGGGIYNRGGHPTVQNCTFKANRASGRGGALYNLSGGLTLRNCDFRDNAAYCGGGMWSRKGCPTLINCIFSENSASFWAAAIGNEWSGLLLSNCTLSRNVAGIDGGGLFNHNSYTTLTNCILWDNEPQAICDNDGAATVVTYSDVQGGWYGKTNIDSYPDFADADNGDIHLKSQAGRWDHITGTRVKDRDHSPCIDAGDPNSPIGDEPFPNGGRVNMGAYGGTDEASLSPLTPLQQFTGQAGLIKKSLQIVRKRD
jgi:hypothetical protein